MGIAVLVICFVFTGGSVASKQAKPTLTAAQEGISLPIVMYHSILKDTARAGDYVLSPQDLENDLDYLQQNGYQTITVADLIAYVQQGCALPAKPVMITFDDGYYNNFVYAYPLLKERGMRAVLSVIGKQTALFSENGQENAYWSHVTLEQLQQMCDVMEVQNHSYDLHTYGQRRGSLRKSGEDMATYTDFLKQDILQVQKLLTDAGIQTPTCYTYPFGALSNESEEIVKGMGFACTLGCEEGMNIITREAQSLYRLKRYNRPSGISTQAFFVKMLQVK